MSSIICPRCGSQVPLRRFFNTANKPFCSHCGWNLARAGDALAAKRNIFRILPLGIAIIGMLVAFGASRSHSVVPLLPLSLFALIILALFWNFYSARRAIEAAKLTANPDLAIAQPPVPQALQMLQSLPRPRRVRFKIQGNLAAIAILPIAGLAFVGFFLAGAQAHRQNFHQTKDSFTILLPFLVMLIVFAILIVVPLFREKRSLPLLRDGELAFARVTAQQMVQQGKTSYSRIDYEFTTNTGQQVRNSSRDLTNSVFEDMTIPVFYDPLDPSKNIVSCATYLKVVDSFE
jgi:phage tail protein X